MEDRRYCLMVEALLETIAFLLDERVDDVFLQWLQHFQQHFQSTEMNPILLILNHHN